ncbi:hypothetical protein B0H14DRAFT_3432326 [Mycena olivaceomarginata]|nr:hypothetical protein B0H14DRAFT_3432326 [Mycena olivaceomarginata]
MPVRSVPSYGRWQWGSAPSLSAQEDHGEQPVSALTFNEFIQLCFELEDWSPLSSVASRSFIKLCLESDVTSLGYRQLIESPFIRDAPERPALAQLLAQCTAFEARLREQQRPR